MKTMSIFLCLLVVAFSASAETIRVPDQYATIQAAVESAQPGDEVQVAAGTYNDCTHQSVNEAGAEMMNCVIMKSGVSLIGAGSESTIIDAQGLGRVILADSCAAGTRIEGFTLTGGHLEGSKNGAGLNCYWSAVECSDLTFVENGTEGNGGGVSIFMGANRMTDCFFNGNYVLIGYGGAIHCVSSSSEFERCRVTGSSGYNGTVVCDQSDGAPTFKYCLFDHNQSHRGVVWTGNESQARFEHCTISDSEGESFYTNSEGASLYCCILAFGSRVAMICDEGTTFECCDVYGHQYNDTNKGTDLGGCFSEDPEFVSRESGDYYLQPSSPCQPGNHSGGCNDVVIGAFPPDDTPVQRCSWGMIKASFR